MVIPAPPGMQSWVRDTDRRLGSLERSSKGRQDPARAFRSSQISEADDAVTSIPGQTDGWQMVMGVEGPSISGESTGQRVKITVSAVCEGLQVSNTIGTMSGLLRATLQPANQYRASSIADDEGGLGFGVSFDYQAGSNGNQRFTGSFSRVLNLPIGTYTVRSEHLYTQSSDGLYVRWSKRSLMIEPF